MPKKIYSLMCTFLTIIWIWSGKTYHKQPHEWLFSSKPFKSKKCQLHWLYLRRENLSKKANNERYIVLKPDTCILWGGNEPFCRLHIEHVKVFHVTDTFLILSFDAKVNLLQPKNQSKKSSSTYTWVKNWDQIKFRTNFFCYHSVLERKFWDKR